MSYSFTKKGFHLVFLVGKQERLKGYAYLWEMHTFITGKWKCESCSVWLCDAMDCMVHGILQTRMLVWQAFPSPGDLPNPGLPHCRWILYQRSHKGSPRTLEWVACPFYSESSWPRNQTGVSCIVGRFFTKLAIREAIFYRTRREFKV